MSTTFGLAVIGAGNMAEAILRGLSASPAGRTARAVVADLRADRLAELREKYSLRVAAGNVEAVVDADVVLLSVKPQNVEGVASELAGRLPPAAFLLSIVAGFSTDTLEARFGSGLRVVRAMPNTPAFVGAGITALCAGRHANGGDKELAERIFGTVGQVVWVKEARMDAVTAVSGSGPAYVCYFLEAMLEAAARMGLPPEEARKLALVTVAGTIRLLDETGQDPAEARARVTSKNGATEAALKVLSDRSVRDAWVSAIDASRARSAELGKGL